MASGCVFGGRSLQARSPAAGTENRFICRFYAAALPGDSLFSWSIDALPMLERLGVCGKISPSGVAGVCFIGPRVPVDDRGTPHAIRPIAGADSIVGNDVELVGLSSGVAQKTRMWYTFVLPRLRQLAVSQR